MAVDIAEQIGAIHRTVRRTPRPDGGEDVTLLASRTYRASLADTWSALTEPSRIARWFMPVSGDLRAGGTFHVEGNAGGEILECHAPHRFRVTYGGEASIVEVRLSALAAERTSLEIEHSVPIEMAQSGAGALWVGPGWDGGLMALGLYLADAITDDVKATATSPASLAFGAESVRAWATSVEVSGTATAEELSEAVAVSLAQYAGVASEDGTGRE